jgi:hypothetical protein
VAVAVARRVLAVDDEEALAAEILPVPAENVGGRIAERPT